MINLYFLCFAFLVLLDIDYLFQYNYKVLNGTIECIDKGLYKTCKYKNIYYYNNKWFLFSNNKSIFNNYCVNAYAKKLGKCWKVYIHNIKENKLKKNVDIIFNGLSSPFSLTYTSNYGHAIWDDLYLVYTSIVKLKYKKDIFNLVIYKRYKKTHYLDDILKVLHAFSKGKIIYLSDYSNKIIMFKTLIVGSSHQCQRCVTLDYSLKYSREYNMTKLIRDRMYEVYNIKPHLSYPLKGVIIHNKRFSKYEKSTLKQIITHYHNDKYLRLSYIDYRNITKFYDQLKLMSKTHIYISGPGTGLLNFPFIADPGVVIHLGHIHFGCPQYLEQYILEGSPHFKALYYSPEERMKTFNYSYIITLINVAINYIINNKYIYVKRGENLNEIGKLYVKICKEHKDICQKLIDAYDWGYGKCRGIWAENVVYFPTLYKKIPELKNIVVLYNNTKKLGCKAGINYSKQRQCMK